MDDTTRPGQAARIRALAHPLRLRLLDLLDDEGEATATRCAEVTGESVASCAFHLGQLERYGYVERAPRRGREKPWRVVSRSRTSAYDPAEPATLQAAAALAHETVAREADRLHRWIDATAGDDDAWLLAARLLQSTLWLTTDELAQLGERMTALLEPFTGRDAGDRPDGARRVRVFAALTADRVGTGTADADGVEAGTADVDRVEGDR